MLEPGAPLARGRYTVETRIGQGGMATVWRIVDLQGAPYALKVLTLDRQEVRDRFRAEAEIQRTLDHPNIVRAVEVLDLAGEPGLVMEYVPGRALDAWLVMHAQEGRTVRDRIAKPIVEAVAHAHAKNVVHRDLKPANVLLLETEAGPVPKITDFGLAKQVGGMAATRSGIALGTPRYMAPEQIRDAKRVDARADVWSLGALLYELYTGKPAFHRETLIDIFTAVMEADYVDPAELGVTGALRDAIVGCLKPDPQQRWQSCAALLEALPLAPPPPPAPPPPRVVSVVPEADRARAEKPAAPPPSPTLIAIDLPEPDSLPPPPKPVPVERPRARPARSTNRWLLAWGVAFALVVAAFLVGMTIVGAVWASGALSDVPVADEPEPAAPISPARPGRRRR